MAIKISIKSGSARLALVVSVVAVVLMTPANVYAVTTLSQSLASSSNLSVGSLVSLSPNASDQVVAADTDNVSDLYGVVIDGSNSLLSVGTNQSSQVQVATSGVQEVLVSDINGPVVAGDPITASPIAGVGMLAAQNVKIIGVSESALHGAKQTYKTKNGASGSADIGSVPVDVNVSYFYKQPVKTIIPSALQNVVNSLAGKQVNPLPIIVSAAIFLIMIIVVASIVYSMIRSSIISVGRNPMSQSAIYRDMVQMSALVVGIIAVAVAAIYLILTKL